MVISCSKNLDNAITLDKAVTSKMDRTAKLPNLESIDTVTLCKYLDNRPLTAHEKDSIAKVSTLATSNKNATSTIIQGEYPEYTDYSGQIHLKVFYAYTTNKVQHPILTRSVSADYAMVGGGAKVYGYTGNGAFLTESRPLNGTTWEAQSKDHIIQDPHYIIVFAIGMRIDNVDPAYLRSKIHIVQNTSGLDHFPTASVLVPDNCLLVGGGAWDQYSGYGNMLTASYPYDISWVASGKDYRRSDLSRITAYAIVIENISYPTVGYLQLTVRQIQTPAPAGEQYCYAPVWDGYALTCPGGYCTWDFTGRMLVGLYPQDQFPCAQLISKDTPSYADFGGEFSFCFRHSKETLLNRI